MKKTLTFLILISIQHLTYSQTKQETSDWLIDKLNDNSSVNDGTDSETFCYIKNGNIIEKTYNRTFKTNTIFGIPIKSIKKIIVYKDKLSFNFILDCQSNCVNDQINNIVGKKEENIGKVLMLKINIEDSTLYDRIPKSLTHLIKLYGGNPKLEFKKEPF
jgi:hypothetical protein